MFSYCLVPPAAAAGGTSKLRFGGDPITPLSNGVSTPFLPGSGPTSAYYKLTLDGISIGETRVSLNTSVIIDSGTTLTFLPTSVYRAVRDAVRSTVGVSPVNDTTDLRYEPHEQLSPPDVVFHFKGVSVALKADNILWNRNGRTCLAILPTSDDAGIPIFGNITQVNFEVGYDLKDKLVSFAPTDCTKY